VYLILIRNHSEYCQKRFGLKKNNFSRSTFLSSRNLLFNSKGIIAFHSRIFPFTIAASCSEQKHTYKYNIVLISNFSKLFFLYQKLFKNINKSSLGAKEAQNINFE
jgi:hypothetical protein